MLGLIGNVAISPDESDVVAVTTNCCNRPVDEYDRGLTELTPAMVKMSPLFSVAAPEAQPSVASVLPVCDAPSTNGVDAV